MRGFYFILILKGIMAFFKVKCDELGARKRGHFLYRLFCPKEIFLTFVFYLDL